MENAQETEQQQPIGANQLCKVEMHSSKNELNKTDLCVVKETKDDKKEEYNKLSDSACCSLNESEDSGSKYRDNETNIKDFDDDDKEGSEKDSLECDEDDLLCESGEESVDNNTFNVINTENSESQEISELTNDSSSNCDKIKENGVQGAIAVRVTKENRIDVDASAVDITISEMNLEDIDKEDFSIDYSEESIDNTRRDEEADFEDSFDEESSISKPSEETTAISEDPALCKRDISNVNSIENESINTINIKTVTSDSQIESTNKPTTTAKDGIKRVKPTKTDSPKIKKRIGSLSISSKSQDFKIEIFESKRKPEISSVSELFEVKQNIHAELFSKKEINAGQGKSLMTEIEKCLESPQNSDKPSPSEQLTSTSTSDMTSPDSADKTNSIMLDVSQVIKEESEDSDALSPIRSLTEDAQIASQDHSRTSQENSRKTEPKFLQTEPSTKLSPTNEVQNTNSGTPPKEPFGNKLPVGTHQNDSPGRQLHSSDPVLPEPVKKPTPMAFTVELGDSAASDSSGSGSTGKKLDITASISQWAPKHRRNLSLTKVEENKKVEERQGSEKPPLGRPRSGTVGAGGLQSARRGGYHSEGYFSSDQDDEGPKRTDLKSPRSPRAPPPDTLKPSLALVRSSSQDSSKGNSLRKQGSKSEGRSCCKERERKPSVSELTGKTNKSDKINGSKMVSDSIKQVKNTPTEDIDSSRDVKDDVSETGTYTIDKDSPSPDVDEARNDIDGIFGITTESEVEANSTTTAVPMSTTDQCPEDESSWMSASEVTPAISRNSPNWIQQWAAHVAEQTKPTLSPISSLSKSSVTSPRGNKLPLSSQESNDSRPRRKLPTPPSHLIPSPVGVAQRSLDVTDSPTPLKHRARVDKTKGESPAFRNASFESHESGGDSDIDTSTSYPFNDDERFSASLRSKLRLTGLLPSSKNSTACASSPRRLDGGTVKDPKLKNRELGREGTYEVYAGRRDEHGLHSDSSSEASEPFKETSRSTDSNNPPLKFNRAFSLRRARLLCEEPVSTTPIDKKKINRPSSAGAVGSSRKAPLATTKSYQSVDSSSVSSPRGYGFGSPRGIASSSQNVLSKGTSSDNFDRTDGGRFSLRLPRSGPTSIGIVKSPSKSSIKKETSHSSSKKTALRSNSTLSSKEVDFQNWKRRKNYDPMKAAAEGKKKQVERKTKNILTSVPTSSDNRSPSPVGNLLRSASFHGTEGVMGNVRWTRKNCNNLPHYTSEDDGPCSLEEDVGPHPSPRRGSPIRRSPTSPHQLCQFPAKQTVTSLSRGRRPSLGLSDEGENQYQSSIRKISLDESGSEGKRSPLNGGHRAGGASGNASSGSGRPKTKMEALDNLVISTIHSLSVKVKTTSESLLQKLKSQYDEEGDRAALLEEVLSHLSESDQSVMSGQTRSTSRELAGILRNLKKIEHALEVIDRVIVIGDEEYPEEEELEEVPNEWVESDY